MYHITIKTILWTISLCLIFLFLGKAFAPFINDLINKYLFGIKENKNRHEGFNQLVEYKKSQMRGSKTSQTPPSSTVKKSSFQKRVEDDFKKFSKSGPKKSADDLREIINLFDQLNWGSGKELKKVAQIVETKLKFSFKETTCAQIIAMAIKEKLFDQISEHRPISISVLANILLPVVNMDLINNNIQYQRKIFGKNVSFKHIQKCLGFILFKKEKSQKHPLDHIFSKDFKALNSSQRKALITSYDFSALNNQLKEYNELMSALVPLTVKDKKSHIEALKVLNLRRIPDQKALKKIYKKFVVSKHPDKFSEYKLPSRYTKQINENFTSIQWAYDVLLERIDH